MSGFDRNPDLDDDPGCGAVLLVVLVAIIAVIVFFKCWR